MIVTEALVPPRISKRVPPIVRDCLYPTFDFREFRRANRRLLISR